MFRFTIRELLLLMMIVGLSVGWFLDNRLTASKRVGPPEWHSLLRAVVQDLQRRPDFEIANAQRINVGVLSESGTWYWHGINHHDFQYQSYDLEDR